MNKIRRLFENLVSLSSEQIVLMGLLGMAAFLHAVSIVWLDSAATALYLGTYGRLDLSFLFIAAALFLSIAGFFSVSVERRFGKGLLIFIVLAVALQSGLLYALYEGWKPSLDLLFSLKFAYGLLLKVGFWGLAFRFLVLDLQSKKFLCIVLADFLGTAIGGFSLPLLLQVADMPMMVLANILLGVFLFVLFRLIFHFEKKTPQETLRKNGGVDEPAQLNLMFLIYCASFLYAAVRCFVDYTLCIELIENGKYTLDIGRIMGVLWGTVGALSVVGMGALYRIRNGFNILHGMTVLALLPVVTYLGWLAGLAWIIYFAKVVFELVTYFCVGYYFRMIPRPLTHGHRYRLKVFRLALLEPVGFGFSAVVFYFAAFSKAFGVLGVLLSCAFVVTLWLTHIEYARVLLSSFKTFRWRGGRLLISTPKVIAFVTEKAGSPQADEAIYYLRVLEDAKYAGYKNFIRRALKHKDPRVRVFALNRIEKNNIGGLRKIVSDLLEKDTDLTVRQTALRVMCAMGEKYAQEKAILYLDDPDLKKGALVGLLKAGGEGILIASEGVNKLVASKDRADRLQAAEILEESAIKGFYRLILSLMKDKQVDVRRAALLAAGRIQHPLLLPSVFKALERMDLRDAALEALKGYGPKAYPVIEQTLVNDRTSLMIKKTLISYLWISEDLDAQKVLLQVLQRVPFIERMDVLRHLLDMNLVWSSRKKKRCLLPLIDKDFRQAVIVLLLVKDFAYAPIHEAEEAFRDLRDSLEKEFYQIRKSLLIELKLLYPAALFQQAVNLLLQSPDASLEQRAAAMGIIEDILPKKLRKLKTVLREMPMEERIEKIPSRPLKKGKSLTEQLAFVISKSSYRSPWTRACALMCVRKMGDVSLLPYVVDLLNDPNPLLRQGAVWALGRMGLRPKALRPYLEPLKKEPYPEIRDTIASVLKS